MVLLDLFSGIGGFHLGLERAGFNFDKVYFSEIDKHAVANYQHNFKNAKNVGTITALRGADITRPNIITFGSPCQDFSISGKRAGLQGQRSNLIKEAIRLITETRPDVFIWENVKGTFSSNNGADFWAIIQSFANIGGYRLEWQLLNTSWFLPQNRERIYLVGHLDGRSSPGVFPVGTITKKTIDLQRKENGIAFCLKKLNTNAIQLKQTEYTKGNFQSERVYKSQGISVCLSSSGGGMGVTTGLYEVDSRIRRLTEIECERLQGFPDNWTQKGIYNNEIQNIAKTNRYSLIGNAVTVDVVTEIGRKIKIKH